MTRIIKLLMVLSVPILGITGCGPGQSQSGAGLGDARILSISYEYGSFNGGFWDFDLRTSEGQVLFNAQGSNGVDLEINSQPVPDSVLVELQNLIIDQDIIRWNGFSKQDKNVLDGYGFTLNIDYENGTKLSASGYMKEPDNYKQGHAALSEFFLALAETYNKYSFLE